MTVTRTFDLLNQLVNETVSNTAVWVNSGAMAMAGEVFTKSGTTDVWDAGVRTTVGYAGGAAVSFVPS